MTERLPAATLAYVAGVLDAMGAIRTRTLASDLDLPVAGVQSRNVELARYLAQLTGTRVTYIDRDYGRTVCAAHCPHAHSHVVSHHARWQVTGSRATVLLAAVLPYLQVQRDAALDALAVGLAAPSKPATARKMYELGWPGLVTDLGILLYPEQSRRERDAERAREREAG